MDCALCLVDVGVTRFHGGDVREDFVVAEVAIHGVEDLHYVGWWGMSVVMLLVWSRILTLSKQLRSLIELNYSHYCIYKK